MGEIVQQLVETAVAFWNVFLFGIRIDSSSSPSRDESSLGVLQAFKFALPSNALLRKE